MSLLQEKILLAREQKHDKIKKLKSAFKAVITVKSNFPGDNKQNNFSYLLTEYFVNQIGLENNTHVEFNDGFDGPFYLIGIDEDPVNIKQRMMDIEDNHPLGRFIDLDVFDGKQALSRNKMRKCYLCDRDAFVCIREKNHSVLDLISFMESKTLEYFSTGLLEIIDEVIMLELDLHPKFGLVTPYSNGSHKDMNYELMVQAKDSILPFFKSMFIIGWSSFSFDEIFESIRKIGLSAEQEMLKATKGINAYKGLIFNLGIVVTAYAYCLYNHIHLNHINQIIQKIAYNILEDFNQPSNTFGYIAYKNYQISGARGEVQKGMPHVFKALEYLKEFSEESRLKTLMYLIAKTEDTVFLKRAGNLDFYNQVKQQFVNHINNDMLDVETLNQFCLDHNLSFGGSADLLIVTMFLKKIRALFVRDL